MAHSSPYPSPPHSLPDQSLVDSTLHVLEQAPPPTLREILSAYRSKGGGDRDVLLCMLSAKTAEDQRIAAIANLHQRLLDLCTSSRTSAHDHPHPPHFAHPPIPVPYQQPLPVFAQPAPVSTPAPAMPPAPARPSPTASPTDVKLPPIHAPAYSRKRPRTSQSPPPPKRHHPGPQPLPAPSDQLPPSPPFSSPGRTTSTSTSTTCIEPRPHVRPMAIGSLLSSCGSQNETDTEWPSRTSAERTGPATEREQYKRQSMRASG